jgi:hypothetical protein
LADEVLNISFTTNKDNAKVSAIKILQTNLSTGMNNVLNNLPEKNTLLQIFPNPFTSKTTIHYQLSESTTVKLSINNLFGEQIITLVNEYQAAGSYLVDWIAKDNKVKRLGNGLYLVKLETGNNSVQTMKFILLR